MSKALREPTEYGNTYTWQNVTQTDTPEAVQVAPGKYAINVEGTFGGMSVEIKAGRSLGEEHSLSGGDGAVFIENNTLIATLGSSFVLPVLTGGANANVDISLSPIPN